MSNGTPTPNTPVAVALVPQTGMPSVYASRSKELSYDSLEWNTGFIFVPYGPRKLYLSRPNQHW